MDALPAELWCAIFEFACTDDGSTGASLALVSSYAQSLSQQYRLQSIAIRGRTQLAQLARKLETLPLSHRPRCLFMTLSDADLGYVAPLDAHRVLELVAPRIQALHLHLLRVARISLPACPRLAVLTVDGPLVEANREFPALRILRMSPTAQRPPAVLRDLRRVGPGLQEVYIPLRVLTPHEVMSAFGIAPRNADGIPRRLPTEALLPTSLELLCLEEDRLSMDADNAPCPRQQQLSRKFRELAAKETRLRVAPRVLDDGCGTVGRWQSKGL
ncbi:hypothetical protein FB107DRAFT_264839 [Schizophyllum commune]